MRRQATVLGLTLAIIALAMNDAAGQESPQPKKAESAAKQQPKNDPIAQLLKTQLQAAQRCHQAAVDTMKVEQVGQFLVLKGNHRARPDLVYTWSVRWLDAQRDLSKTKDERIAAFVEHHKRLKDLQTTVKFLVGANAEIIAGAGILPEAEVSAAEWCLAEAELWLLKERGK